MVEGRSACRSCKLKKKRCIHRVVVEPEPEPEPELDVDTDSKPVIESNAAPQNRRRCATVVKESEAQAWVGTSNELSTSDSEDRKIMPKKRAKRGRPLAPIIPRPMPAITDLPVDAIEAASALSVHRVFARELEARIQEYDMSFQVSQKAHRATITSAKAVKRALDTWIEAWSSGS